VRTFTLGSIVLFREGRAEVSFFGTGMRESTNIFRPESPVHPQKLKSSGWLWILLLLFKMKKKIQTSLYLDGTKRIITTIMIKEIYQITFMVNNSIRKTGKRTVSH